MKTAFPNIAQILGLVDVIIDDAKTLDAALGDVSVLLEREVAHYHWVGFYLVDDSQVNLILGPYVGAPTDHTKIAFGSGVCGQVALTEMSRVIQNVDLEENYLSCGINVRSEIVIPIKKKGRFVAELDIDSHALSPFTSNDSELLEAICDRLARLF